MSHTKVGTRCSAKMGKDTLLCGWICNQVDTCAERGLPGPASVRPAGPVLWSSGQIEARLTRIDERVAEGWQFNGPHIRLGRQLRLAAVVGWRKKERRRERQIKEGRAKKKKRDGGGGWYWYVQGEGSEKWQIRRRNITVEEQKFSWKKKYRQGGCEGSNGTVCQHGNVKPSAEGCVFHLTKKYAAAIQKWVWTYQCTRAGNHSRWGWAYMCVKWSPAVSSPSCSWRTPCCWPVTGHAQKSEGRRTWKHWEIRFLFVLDSLSQY